MPDPRHTLGQDAEEATARWLIAEGWTILARRWRAPSGEIDLVARDPRGTLVGVEVRARRTARTGLPLTTVSARHLGRMRRSLAAFAATSGEAATGTRIDLVSLTPQANDTLRRWHVVRMPGIDGW